MIYHFKWPVVEAVMEASEKGGPDSSYRHIQQTLKDEFVLWATPIFNKSMEEASDAELEDVVKLREEQKEIIKKRMADCKEWLERIESNGLIAARILDQRKK